MPPPPLPTPIPEAAPFVLCPLEAQDDEHLTRGYNIIGCDFYFPSSHVRHVKMKADQMKQQVPVALIQIMAKCIACEDLSEENKSNCL